jgi:hypothetical protein
MPVFSWPPASGQIEQPYRTVVGVEWAGLIVAALAFSPQTNTRHLYLLLLVLLPAATMMILPRRGVSLAALLAGILLLWLSLVLPPGGSALHEYERIWRHVGGPSWCMLVMYAALLGAALRYVRAPTSHSAWKGPLMGYLPRWPLFSRRRQRGIDHPESVQRA